MTGVLWNFCAFIVALGILIAIHEFGHFWVARRCGVYVERFSIGFGKTLWCRRGKDGTEYTLAMIPLGGYVKMLDERVEAVPESRLHLAFNRKPLWQRSAIVAAGPIANFLFAFVAYWAVFILGVPSVKPIIGDIQPQSIAAEAHLRSGMEIVSVNGMSVMDWQDVSMGMVSRVGDNTVTVTTKMESEQYSSPQTHTLDISAWQFDPEGPSILKTLGITPFSPEIFAVVSHIVDGSAAAKAGLKDGDRFLMVDNVSIKDWSQLVSVVRSHPNKTLAIKIDRNGIEKTLLLTPSAKTLKNGQIIGFMGVSPTYGEWPKGYVFDQQYSPFSAIGESIAKTGQMIELTFVMVKKLIIGDVALNNLSGPISIAKGAGMTADFGLVYFLGFLALISVNLGIVNLLPLPVLDGGHLLFFSIEAIMRRPVSERVQEIGYKLGSAILMVLMAIALFNDFARL